ncbi:hypothetical protein CC1G_01867 [Coprinopsis cinerea okayama7|uniref:Spindle pole body component n=1 Tax=Coprinopsis cinerea (strain Okayama-7 / 130 / ATCC MYA-4618 / FGSC 9003) TaxID=240176 RepID=A8N2Q3_COPC7|nr:hypothetical protein CC1G_01867 [Coprinopsis cinerea okayama7\|eukprot:XP_001829187.2 hypothetical protein CC1G_01867 [Coprinopsis cinerea okayama7\
MIAEILLILAGHSSSLFPTDYTLNKDIIPLLHPGERQCLESLGLIAHRYRKVRSACTRLSQSSSRYICALCASLSQILKEEYDALVVETEAKVLKRDALLVASGAFVPLSSVRAIFSEWDAPLAALSTLMDDLQSGTEWKAGPLIDMLLSRSKTGVHRVADILSRLSVAVQCVWRSHLTALLVHGSLSDIDPLANADYSLIDTSIPSCITPASRESIAYVGRAIGTVKAVKWQKQLPRELAMEHTKMLQSVLPEDQHAFDRVISQIRTDVGEWLWHNVLTRKDIDIAVDSLGDYFLLRNGEFSLSLIREIERLKISRLTNRSAAASMIREQDLNLALLRASLGTTAQHDPALTKLRFHLPSGPLRPLLPSLANVGKSFTGSTSMNHSGPFDASIFNSHLLGTPMSLLYSIEWPLDLFISKVEMTAYGAVFSFLSSMRKTHIRVHDCWTSLSNAQRARRKWTGLDEGGTEEDLNMRKKLLRRSWGIVRDMGWFLDTLLGYVMMDVVDLEFRKLKEILSKEGVSVEPTGRTDPATQKSSYLDFTSIRTIHSGYLDRVLNGCLLTNPSLTSLLESILVTCEQFVAQVERWGGDVLPALLFEGSLRPGEAGVGDMVKERWSTVADIDKTLRHLFESFYEQLNSSISQQPLTSGLDTSRSLFIGSSVANHSTVNFSRTMKGLDKHVGDSRRHIERLLLRLDFNGGLSKPRSEESADILKDL